MKLLTRMLPGFLLLIALPIFAQNQPVLNSISYQLSAQGWAKTDTARVVIDINATLSNGNLSAARQQILNKLNGLLLNVEWNLTTFARSQDQSGLQKLTMRAETRLNATQVSSLQDKIKTISKAGQKFSIMAMTFQPSFIEIEETNGTLRQKIYREINTELKRLNSVYPKQRYFLHSLNFLALHPVFQTAMLAKVPSAVLSRGLTVSNRVTLTANVVLSSVVKTQNGS